MSDLDYMEKYGDDGYQLDGSELEEEQRRIDEEEELEQIQKCINKINEIIKLNDLHADKDRLLDELEELKNMTEEL